MHVRIIGKPEEVRALVYELSRVATVRGQFTRYPARKHGQVRAYLDATTIRELETRPSQHGKARQ
jgi:hypothetical protein